MYSYPEHRGEFSVIFQPRTVRVGIVPEVKKRFNIFLKTYLSLDPII
jgi:hypothetical protein